MITQAGPYGENVGVGQYRLNEEGHIFFHKWLEETMASYRVDPSDQHLLPYFMMYRLHPRMTGAAYRLGWDKEDLAGIGWVEVTRGIATYIPEKASINTIMWHRMKNAANRAIESAKRNISGFTETEEIIKLTPEEFIHYKDFDIADQLDALMEKAAPIITTREKELFSIFRNHFNESLTSIATNYLKSSRQRCFQLWEDLAIKLRIAAGLPFTECSPETYQQITYYIQNKVSCPKISKKMKVSIALVRKIRSRLNYETKLKRRKEAHEALPTARVS